MTIGKKIIGGYAVVLALLVIAVVTGYYALSMVQDKYSGFFDVDEKRMDDAGTLRLLVEAEIADYRAVLLYPDQKEYLNGLQGHYREFDTIVEGLRKSFSSDVSSGESLSLLEDIANLQTRYRQEQDKVFSNAQQGNRTEAIGSNTENVSPLRRELVDKIERFLELQVKLREQKHKEVMATANNLSLIMLVISLAALASGLIIGFSITRSITRQLRDATTQISSASAEILATTTQLASNASETATAVSQTNATAEEVKQTAQLSSEKATNVSESAKKAASVAKQGQAAVTETIDGINLIKRQSELVAESIVKLSEQSQAIGEIITTVNDLAEQSNLLAVNAAIEAAKAGEQGKGFAVVAQEVKSLAEQSKQATAQVRAILNDVQKATSASVMATEQVTKAVDVGVKQTTEAGDSIRKLADTNVEAAQAATQVAASSQQQLVGMNQIASAMENIRQATQQNAAGAKQAEKAAQNLNELGQKLKALVEPTKT